MNDLELLRRVCSLPTAPFAEGRVGRFIKGFARDLGLRVQEDRWGNMLLTTGARAGGTRWVMVAHTDHPGLVARRQQGGRVAADFRGYVLASCLKRGQRVRFFTDDGEVAGKIITFTAETKRHTIATVVCEVKGEVPSGTPGMFDVAMDERGDRFRCRAIDDLAGVAAALVAMRNASRAGAKLAALFTRGEEAGFIGAIAAAREGKGGLLRPGDQMLSIECSAAQSYAPLGCGVIIRVGDRMSVFDPALTQELAAAAKALEKSGRGFKWTRALMPGGTCEATAFNTLGYRAAAVCIPLGNYHNMNAGRNGIVAETIRLSDWRSLTRLLSALGHSPAASVRGNLQAELLKRFVKHCKLLGSR